ncbi:MAG: winged helix-turn-helix domain-containing protein, partial [Gammaproteobacteria bacterium]|nr:winged helix-turn-helix domain-containing protein [Gammaproteobacteria bacterium]
LMDWMLPDMSGVDLTRRLKKDEYSRDIPLIMLTAKSEIDDRVKGLEAGADDYVPKPFSPRELVARIRAVLRRTVGDDLDASLSLGGVTLDDETHRVTADGRELEMGPTEFRLLRFFLANPERVFSREQILDYVWGRNSFLEERTVDVHIRRLRKSLESAGKDGLIQTVRGVGYRCSDRLQTS